MFELFGQLPLPLQVTLGVVLIWLILDRSRLTKIKNYHSFNLNHRKIEGIERHLEKGVGPELSRILESAKDEKVFEDLYGFTLDRGRRDALIPIIQAEDRPFGWQLVKDIIPYLKAERGAISVHIPKLDKIQYMISPWVLLTLIFSAMALTLSALSEATAGNSLSPGAIFGTVFVVFIPVATMFPVANSMVRIATAKKLERYLRQASSTTEPQSA